MELSFQSLIWVACPTGHLTVMVDPDGAPVSIPHMGCMPYGQCGRPCRCSVSQFQSLIWVACPTGKMPTNHFFAMFSFNPSYGLHALRAPLKSNAWAQSRTVSIPHMGCMPYGLRLGFDIIPSWDCFNPSYGLHALRAQVTL